MRKVGQELGEEFTEDDLLRWFRNADLDDDGFVTQDDFYNMMTHRVYWDNV